MSQKSKTIAGIILLLITIQLILFGMERCIFLFFERTEFTDSMATMSSMLVVTVLFIIFAAKKKMPLSIFPGKFGLPYIIVTAVVAIILVSTPSNFTGDIQPVLLLVYGSIVTPIFEEVIFRGYVWNKLRQIFAKELTVYIVTTVLFALWHIGYISSVALRVDDSLGEIMFWKVITGLCFGIVLGLLRMKTKNCYSTMLLHCVLNIFGR